ncbi:pectin acetylesterase-family hydrolase [Actinoplanes sp. L3-i22]|uniref:pectin acetylesterase-family hydrolase n=1 Tax=Actinoplanes sp. L3-i22 TaxID=2836373 RepID=UPI001C76DBCB|nr:pectin acetylesterase-family hydrolase [Actinoplanes sp. L3-i22]BCY08501.1 vtpJ-therm [Actinoplanes sp. L3-i22]
MTRTPLILLAVLALVLAGCRSTNTASTALTGTHTAMEWTRVAAPQGDCHCADGSPFAFWERRADPTRVVFFLNGGGVCWSAATCAFTSTDSEGENDDYAWNLSSVDPGNRSGMFDTTHSGNPFADYSFLYVSSCTGDAHLGKSVQKYSPQLTVDHNGLANGTAAIDYLAAHYPDVKQVVVIGKTAGSVAAPLYGGLIADKLPKAQVVVFGAQSGAWPDNAKFNTDILGTTWGAYAAMPGWAIQGLTVDRWAVPTFWIQAGRHDPELVLARFDFAYDPHAYVEVTNWTHGDPTGLLALTDANEKAIEAAGITLHSYTAPGADHQIFEPDKFYSLAVNGVHLSDWLGKLVTDDPPADVHCTQCGP